jgi:hypothetical protein
MNFQLSQLLLLLAIFLLIIYVFRVRTVLTDRLIYLSLIVVGVVFVVNPALSTRVANLIGIGRGADLLLYIFVIFSMFQHIVQGTRTKTLERNITLIVRKMAIDGATYTSPDPDELDRRARGASTSDLLIGAVQDHPCSKSVSSRG